MKIRDRIKSLRRVRAGDLRPNPKNWRKHPEGQQNALRGILAEVGWADAVLARETEDGLMLIDGHLRAEVAPDEEVPVLVLDVDESDADKILSTHDPLAGMAEMDVERLTGLLDDIDFDSDSLEAMFADMPGLDVGGEGSGDLDDPEPQIDKAEELCEQWGVESGQLWEVKGQQVHRLLCGDSTDSGALAGLFGGDKCRLIATDPPYGVDFSGAKYCPTAKAWEGVQNDTKQGLELREWMATVWPLWLVHCHGDASFYCWSAPMEEGAQAAAAMRDSGIHIQSQIVWVKNNLVLGQADYQWRHETCWYGFLNGKKHRWLGGRSQTTVWEVARVPSAKYEHPMQKPVELYAKPIRNHTGEGDVCGDPFLGSGTTMVAAEQLGRRCFGCEIEPKYVAVTLDRMTKLGCECVCLDRGETK